MSRSAWRRILGWFLTVLGVLIALTGLIGILGSGQPGVTDPAASRTGGIAFIVLGLIVAAPGLYLVVRKARPTSPAAPSLEQVELMKRSRWRRILGWVLTVPGGLVALVGLIVRKARAASRAALGFEELEKQIRRDRRTMKLVYTSISVLLLGAGIFSYVYSLSLTADVQGLESAVPRGTHPGDPNCYQLRDVLITTVDVSHNRQGEIDVVKFLDAGGKHEVRIQPGNLDSSVLRAGAPSVATLWRGKYTNLEVEGTGFVTQDNPVGQRDEFRAIALIGVVMGLVMGAGLPVIARRHRRRGDDWAIAETWPWEPVSEYSTAPVSYPGLPLLIRPRPWLKQISIGTLVFVLGSLLITYIAVAPYGQVLLWTLISIDTAGIALVLAWKVLSSVNSGLFVDDMSFGALDALGRRHAWPRSEAGRVVRRWIVDGRARRMPFDAIFIVGTDGHAKVSFATSRYSRSDILQYVSALRLNFDETTVDTPITQAELNREIPGSASWISRHSYVAAAGFAVALIVAITTLVVITTGPSHR